MKYSVTDVKKLNLFFLLVLTLVSASLYVDSSFADSLPKSFVQVSPLVTIDNAFSVIRPRAHRQGLDTLLTHRVSAKICNFNPEAYTCYVDVTINAKNQNPLQISQEIVVPPGQCNSAIYDHDSEEVMVSSANANCF